MAKPKKKKIQPKKDGDEMPSKGMPGKMMKMAKKMRMF